MESAGTADIGGGTALAYAGEEFGAAMPGLEMSLELTTTIGPSAYLGELSVTYAEPATSELDAELIDTINDIGTRVLSEVLGELVAENGMEVEPDQPALDYAHDELPLADKADEVSPLYVPSEWVAAPQAESEQDEVADTGYEQPLIGDEVPQPADFVAVVSEPSFIDDGEIDLQAAEITQPTPAVASIVEAINTELLPEDDMLAEEPVTSVLYSAETSDPQSISISHEVFETLIMQRGVSLDGTAHLEAEGEEDGIAFTDSMEYVAVDADLTLILHTRTYTESGTSTANVVATPSLVAYLQQEDKKQPERDVVQTTWNKEEKAYDVEWEDPYSKPVAFPEDVEVTLRQTFTHRWQAKGSAADTVVLDAEDPEAQEREDDYIVRGVDSAITSARPQALKPRVVGP